MTVEQIAPGVVQALLLIVGGFLLWRSLVAWAGILSARRWTRVEGEIVACDIIEVPCSPGEIIHAASGYVPRVRYQFPWRGETRHGSRICVTGMAVEPYRAARERAEHYRPGAKVSVLHHPSEPSRAALQCGNVASTLIPAMTGLACFSLAWLLF